MDKTNNKEDSKKVEFRKVYGKRGSNSMIFNLPMEFAQELGIARGDHLRITKISNSIVIKKLMYKED